MGRASRMSRSLSTSRAALAALGATGLGALLCGSSPATAPPASAGPGMARLPIVFEENRGQTDGAVKFVARAPGYTLFLQDDGAVFRLKPPRRRRSLRDSAFDRPSPEAVRRLSTPDRAAVVRLGLAGARRGRARGAGAEGGGVHYLKQRRVTAPAYRRAEFAGVYPGVDLVYYGSGGQVEYDFVVAPGADPAQVRLAPEGADRVALAADGRILLHAGNHVLAMERPVAYQDGPGGRSVVDSAYALDPRSREIRFRLGSYDPRRELVIDPIVRFASLFGGAGMDYGLAVAMDAQRNTYVAGYTESVDFPGAGAAGGDGDAYVMKVSADGQRVDYVVLLGGTGVDAALGVAVDPLGRALVCGFTDSANFPVVAAAQPALGGGMDAFVARLAADGSAIQYATYLGGAGSDGASRLAVDGAGRAYVTGFTASANFPNSPGAFQGQMAGDYDAFVTAIEADGSFLASTYLGGTDGDSGSGVRIHSDGSVYVGGSSDSGDFPTTAGTFRPDFRGGRFGDAFVVRLLGDLTGQLFGSYVGGTGSDSGAGIGLDPDGNVLVAGTTDSIDLMVAVPPVVPFHTAPQGGLDAYLCKLNPLGGFTYISYFGTTGDDVVRACALDSDLHPVSKAYLYGETDGGLTFPHTDPVQPPLLGASTPFLAKLHEHLFLIQPQLMCDYATQLGGFGDQSAGDMAIDAVGNIALTGDVFGADFPSWLPFDNRRPSTTTTQGFVMRMDDGYFTPGGRLAGPGRVNFGTVRSGTLNSRDLLIRNTHPSQPLAVKVVPPAIPLTLTNTLLAVVVPPRGQHRIRVNYVPQNLDALNGVIRVYSSDPTRPTLAIRVVGAVRPAPSGGGGGTAGSRRRR